MDVRDAALRSRIGRSPNMPSDFTDPEPWRRVGCAPVQARVDIKQIMPLTEEERALFALARERIIQGILPDTVPRSVWAGAGSRSKCSLCGETIEPEQVEYELKGSARAVFRFHVRCHAIWQLAATDSVKGA